MESSRWWRRIFLVISKYLLGYRLVSFVELRYNFFTWTSTCVDCCRGSALQRGWAWWSLKVPPNSYSSVVLCFCNSLFGLGLGGWGWRRTRFRLFFCYCSLIERGTWCSNKEKMYARMDCYKFKEPRCKFTSLFFPFTFTVLNVLLVYLSYIKL